METPPGPGVASPAAHTADGLRAAWRLFLEGNLPVASELCAALWPLASGAAAADIATLLSKITRRQDQLDEALRWALEARAMALAAHDAGRECLARVQHARVLSILGLTEAALEESYAALRAAATAGGPRFEAAGLEALADVQWSLSQWDDGLASYGRMLLLAQASGDTELQAIAHGGLGGMHHHIGKLALETQQPAEIARAKEHFVIANQQALLFRDCAWAIGDLHNARTATHNHAVALLAQGDTARARSVLLALLADPAGRHPSSRALTLKNIGDIDCQEGHFHDAVPRLREALAQADATGQPHMSMECCSSLVTACEAVGDLASALAYHQRFHALYVQVSSAAALVRGRAMSVAYETERARAAAKAQQHRAEHLEDSNRVLAMDAERLSQMTLQDALTGIGNRRRFDDALLAADAWNVNPGAPGTPGTAPRACSLAILDIDRFKRVNDTFSHQVGDAVLRRIGSILAANSRRVDTAARYGGEEFALLMLGLSAGAARQVCDRVRLAVQDEDWALLAPGLRVTVRMGLAHRPAEPDAPSMQALVECADRRLYAAKRQGRNQVVDAGGDPPPAAPG